MRQRLARVILALRAKENRKTPCLCHDMAYTIDVTTNREHSSHKQKDSSNGKCN